MKVNETAADSSLQISGEVYVPSLQISGGRSSSCLDDNHQLSGKKMPRDFQTDDDSAAEDFDNHGMSSRIKRGKVDSLSDEFAHRLSLTYKRAKVVKENLSPEYPSFVKVLLSGSHLLLPGLPISFCNLHLPMHDVVIVLEDESGLEHKVTYLAAPREFNCGWSRFSASLKLVEGDCLVFHLVGPCKFKVYIVRSDNDPDGSVNDLDGSVNDPDELAVDPWGHLYLSYKEDFSSSEDNIDDYGRFKIVVKGEIVGDELLSDAERVSYHDLCCVRKSYLHKNLPTFIDSAMAAKMISETIHVADEIRRYKLSTPEADIVRWGKTLTGFENLGMDVGFVHDRLKRVVSLAEDFKSTKEYKRSEELKKERESIDGEMYSLEQKMTTLRLEKARIEHDIAAIRADLVEYEGILQQEARAPW